MLWGVAKKKLTKFLKINVFLKELVTADPEHPGVKGTDLYAVENLWII